MQIIPVIDLKGGQVVRALRGERAAYAPIATPLAAGSAPEAVVAGFLRLHEFETIYVADLDAIERRGDHAEAIDALARAFPQVSFWVDDGAAHAPQGDRVNGRRFAPPSPSGGGSDGEAIRGGVRIPEILGVTPSRAPSAQGLPPGHRRSDKGGQKREGPTKKSPIPHPEEPPQAASRRMVGQGPSFETPASRAPHEGDWTSPDRHPYPSAYAPSEGGKSGRLRSPERPESAPAFRLANLTPVIGSESLARAPDLSGEAKAILSLDFRGDAFLGPRALLDDPRLWPPRVIAMTLARVGAFAGPDMALLSALARRAPGKALHAAGGLRDARDLEALAALGLAGVLVASALHEGRLSRDDLRRT